MTGQDPFPNLLSLTKAQQEFPEIIAYSQSVTPDLLVYAYQKGIFPWPITEEPTLGVKVIPWFCPFERGVLFLEDLHCPRSFAKWLKKGEIQNWRITLDQDFESVIAACAKAPRAEGRGTWITPMMRAAYLELHYQGIAHSVEVWDESQALVGGLYGVDGGGVFCGESMFYKKTNASKAALWFLAQRLKDVGWSVLDTQMVTSVTDAFGAKLIERGQFLRLLDQSQKQAQKQNLAGLNAKNPWDQKILYPLTESNSQA